MTRWAMNGDHSFSSAAERSQRKPEQADGEREGPGRQRRPEGARRQVAKDVAGVGQRLSLRLGRAGFPSVAPGGASVARRPDVRRRFAIMPGCGRDAAPPRPRSSGPPRRPGRGRRGLAPEGDGDGRLPRRSSTGAATARGGRSGPTSRASPSSRRSRGRPARPSSSTSGRSRGRRSGASASRCGPPRYRTWSLKRVKDQPGRWRVEVLDPIGRSLGVVDFTVQPPKID